MANPTPTPVPTPVVVTSFLAKVESLVVKESAIASTVVGALTAADKTLPVAVSAVLVAIGPFVYTVERYWRNIKKAL